MATQAAAGAAAISASNFPLAIKEYTAAISQLPNAPQYYISRSTAYLRLSPPDIAAALHDAEYAVTLAFKRANKELIAQAQMRRGIALFRTGRVVEASKVFAIVRDKGGAWVKSEGMGAIGVGAGEGNRGYGRPGIKGVAGLETWEVKCQTAMKNMTEVEMDVDVPEDPKTEAPVVGGGSSKAENTASVTSKTPTTTTNQSKSESSKITTIAAQTPASSVKTDWYQTSSTIVITLLAKGIPKDNTTTIQLNPTSISVSWPLLQSQGSSDYSYELDPLSHPIDPTKSSHRILSTKLELTLHKVQQGQKWHGLEGISGEGAVSSTMSVPSGTANGSTSSAPAAKAVDKPPSYPTSSRNGPKNWDTLISVSKDEKSSDKATTDSKDKDDDITLTEAEADGSADASDPASAFFKKIYAGADPDTRRAMIKSFQESNGTALSTNWKEVGSKQMKTSPPEGMEEKHWER